MKVRENPDREYARDVRKRLNANGGHCPCRLEKTQDTVCMCKEFRDQIKRGEEGYCHCGLYTVEADDE